MNVAFQSKSSIPKIGRIDYDYDEAWCAMCGRKKKLKETSTNRKGQVRCRKCGRLVRANPHNKAKGNIKKQIESSFSLKGELA